MTVLLTQDEEEVGADVATVFIDSVPESVARAGMLLALCLGIGPHDLNRMLQELWPDTSDPDAAIAELSSWPFLLRSDETWTVLESVAGPLAARLRESDPARFRAAHEWLFTLEESRRTELEGDPDQGWFLRGRLAFYLSGFAPDRADRGFGVAFETAPILERTTCRIWLSDLVLRQASFLDEQARAPAFFLGYRYYVANDRATAARYFDQVLEADGSDLYQAIALHLRALCEPFELDNKIAMLQRSIELSRRLRLTVNLVMASHSLTLTQIQKANESDRAGDRNMTITYLSRAVQLAEQNAALAATTDDESLNLWTRRTKAMTRWLSIVGPEHAWPVGPQDRLIAAGLLHELDELLEVATRINDVESELFVLSSKATIYDDLRDYVREALETLEDAAELAAIFPYPSSAIRQLARTAESVRAQVATSFRDAERLTRVIQRLDR